MPEVDGLGVVRLIRREKLPLIAFVTAYDEYAVRAFEMNAVDYLLKPVDQRDCGTRSIARSSVSSAPSYGQATRTEFARRQRITRSRSRRRAAAAHSRSESATTSILVPVEQVVSVVADGELLHLTHAGSNERHTITIASRISRPGSIRRRFVRISRGTLLNDRDDPEDHAAPGGTDAPTDSPSHSADRLHLQGEPEVVEPHCCRGRKA